MIIRESWNPVYLVKFKGKPALDEAFDNAADARAYAKAHIGNEPVIEGFDAYFDAFGSVEKETKREIVPLTESDEEEPGETENSDEPSLEDRLSALEDAVSELGEKVETIEACAESPEEETSEEKTISDEISEEETAEEAEAKLPENPFDLEFGEPESTEVIVSAEIPEEDVEKIESPEVKVEIDGVQVDGEIEQEPEEEESELEEAKVPEFARRRREKIAKEFGDSLKESGWQSAVDEIVAGWDRGLAEADASEIRKLACNRAITLANANGKPVIYGISDGGRFKELKPVVCDDLEKETAKAKAQASDATVYVAYPGSEIESLDESESWSDEELAERLNRALAEKSGK